MRHYIPCWETIGIKKDRYLELLHFCRQYPEWKAEASSLVGTHGLKMDGMPHGSTVGDPVANSAERRAGLLSKIDTVDRCARGVGGGEWYTALIQNVCMGRSYSRIDATLFPTSKRQAFFRARKDFFSMLNLEKDKDETFCGSE